MATRIAEPLRAAERYLLKPPLRVSIANGAASLIDVSISGARIEHARRIVVGEILTLNVESSNSMPLHFNVEVVWSHPTLVESDSAPDWRYMSGLRVVDQAEVFQDFVTWLLRSHLAFRVQERRLDPRYVLQKAMGAVFTNVGIVLIENLSLQGIGIRMSQTVRPTTRGIVQIILPDVSVEFKLQGSVRWCQQDKAPGDMLRWIGGVLLPGSAEKMKVVIDHLTSKRLAALDLSSMDSRIELIRAALRK